MGRPKGSKNKNKIKGIVIEGQQPVVIEGQQPEVRLTKPKPNLSNVGERAASKVTDESKYRPMTPADKDKILELAKTKTIKEISGIVGFDMDWIAYVIDALMPDIERKIELTKNFMKGKLDG